MELSERKIDKARRGEVLIGKYTRNEAGTVNKIDWLSDVARGCRVPRAGVAAVSDGRTGTCNSLHKATLTNILRHPCDRPRGVTRDRDSVEHTFTWSLALSCLI